MSNAYLKKKLEERAALSDAATEVLDTAAEDNRDPSDEESKQLANWAKRVKELDAEIKKIEAMINGNNTFSDVLDRVTTADEALETRSAKRRKQKVEVTEAPKSFGERFVESDAFKNYRGHGSMEPVEFKGFLEGRVEGREAITTGSVPVPSYLWSGPQPYTTTTPLLNVIGRESVSSGAVEYITWGTADPLAGEVPEGTLKPEADITPEEHTLSLKTYAHYKAISRQALEDFPRIQSIVEGKLRGGLANKLEAVAAETLIGDTTIPTVVNADILAGIRQGIGQVEAAGYAPNAILLNPTDFANLDVEAAGQAGNGPTSFGSYWGVPAIAVGAIPEGSTYVGNFNEALTWFDRNTTAVYMTDSHADFFVRNLLVILAEQRAGFAVTDPTAAALVTATTPAAVESRAARK